MRNTNTPDSLCQGVVQNERIPYIPCLRRDSGLGSEPVRKTQNTHIRSELRSVLGSYFCAGPKKTNTYVQDVFSQSRFEDTIFTAALDRFVTDRSISQQRPFISAKMGVEFVAGALGSVLGGVGFGIGSMILTGGSDNLGVSVGFLTGFIFGSAAGVSLVGNRGDDKGSFGSTLIGSAMGTIAAIIPAALFASQDDTWPAVLIVVLPSVDAVIGFNMSRKGDSPPASASGLINVKDGSIRLAVPNISFRPDPFATGELMKTVKWVKVQF